jgi:hypothetical protein
VKAAPAGVAPERALYGSCRRATQHERIEAREALFALMDAPRAGYGDRSAPTPQLEACAGPQAVGHPGGGQDGGGGNLSTELICCALSVTKQLQQAQAAAGDVAALRALQPHNHDQPKNSHKIPPLTAGSSAAAQTAGNSVGVVKQPRGHERVEAPDEAGQQLFQVKPPINRCDACREESVCTHCTYQGHSLAPAAA